MTILPELRARPAQPGGEADILWYHPGFCRFPLPVRPGSAEPWQRERDGTSVAIEPGTERDRVPGGPMLRRLLMHLCDSSVRSGQPQVPLGDDAEALAAAMAPPVPIGLVPVLEAQTTALFGCRIVVATEGGPGLSVLDARGRPRAGAAEWRGTVRLNARFLDNLQRDRVALDREAVGALTLSPLALDLYVWLAAALPEQETGVVLAESWSDLQGRFAAPGQDAESFQAEAAAALALLRRTLPALDIDEDAIGVGFSARGEEAATDLEPPRAPEPQPVAPVPVQPAADPATPDPVPAETPAPQPHWRQDERRSREDRLRDDRPREDRPRDDRPRDDRPRDDRRTAEPRVQDGPAERERFDRDRPDRDRFDRDRPDRDRPDRERQDRERYERDRTAGQPLRQTISLRSHLTGLQQVVWLQRAQGRDNVVIEVTPGTRYDPNLVTVLTLEPIVLQVAGGLHARDFERVSSWAAANRDLIDAFWEGEIDNFDEILSRVRKVPAPGADRWRV